LDPYLSAKVPNHVRKTFAGQPGEECKDIPACATGKAVENLLGGTHREGGILVCMERAEPLEVLPGSGEGDMLSDDIRNVDTILDAIDDIFRNQTSTHESRAPSFRLARPDGTVAK